MEGNTPQTATTRFAVLLFSDIVGSTELKERHGVPAYQAALRTHNRHFERIAREVHGIRILQNTGDGYFAEAAGVADAVRFALLFQHALREGPWGEVSLSARTGIHVGEVTSLDGEGVSVIVAPAADLAARVTNLAVGGQILVTRFPFEEARHFIREHPPVAGQTMPPLRWVAHGPYLLKGREEPMEIFEVGAEGLAPLTAPPDNEKAKRAIRPSEDETSGWRSNAGTESPNPHSEKPKRPDLGPLVTKMCNRAVAHEQFQRFFSQHSQQSPGRPQIVFVRGWERERLDSLVARFCGTTLRRHAERIGGKYHGALDERAIFEWPVSDTPEVRHRMMLELLFDLYDCPTVPVDDASAAEALVRLFRERRYPLVVLQFHVRLGHWNRSMLQFIECFLHFWDEVGRAPTAGERTHVVLFFHLVYPDLRGLRLWFGWCFFRPKRVERELARLLEARTGTDEKAKPCCPAVLLCELGQVEREDVIHWFKRHHILGDSMKVWQTHCDRIFGDKVKLPMMDVEDALLAIYEQHLEKRRTI